MAALPAVLCGSVDRHLWFRGDFGECFEVYVFIAIPNICLMLSVVFHVLFQRQVTTSTPQQACDVVIEDASFTSNPSKDKLSLTGSFRILAVMTLCISIVCLSVIDILERKSSSTSVVVFIITDGLIIAANSLSVGVLCFMLVQSRCEPLHFLIVLFIIPLLGISRAYSMAHLSSSSFYFVSYACELCRGSVAVVAVVHQEILTRWRKRRRRRRRRSKHLLSINRPPESEFEIDHDDIDVSEPLLELQSVITAPEDAAGWLSTLTFNWMSKFISEPTLSNHFLTIDWLPRLPSALNIFLLHDTAKDLISDMSECCDKRSNSDSGDNTNLQEREQKQKERKSLFRVMSSVFGKTFYPLGILRFVGDTMAFAGPLFLNAIVLFIEDSDEKKNIWYGYAYAAGLSLITLCVALVQGQYQFRVARVGIALRGVLTTFIFRKVLSLPAASRIQFDSGELLDLAFTDVDRVVNFCQSFHQLWSLPFQIIVTLVLLWHQVGVAALAGLGISLCLVPINKSISNRIGSLSGKMMKERDDRVRLITEVVRAAEFVKLSSLEAAFVERVETIRKRELSFLKYRKYLDAICVYLWIQTPVLIALLTFSWYALSGHSLTSAKAFTCVALFQTLVTPLNAFPWVINGLVEANVSAKRIERLLCCSEDTRSSRVLNSTTQTEFVSPSINSGLDISIRNAVFTMPGSTLQLRIPLLDIPRGSLVIVTGGVGAGCSSLLLALLGELSLLSGEIAVHGRLSLCVQEPWIQRMTFRENILWGHTVNETRLQAVVSACALEQDVKSFPDELFMNVAEAGANLSGGQRMRLALARAVYANADVLLLDNVLASLDGAVKKHICEHVFGPCGLLAQKTSVVVTHTPNYLLDAYNVEPSIMTPKRTSSDVIVILLERGVARVLTTTEVEALGYRNDISSNNDASHNGNERIEIEGLASQSLLNEERAVGAVSLRVYKKYAQAIGSIAVIFLSIFFVLMQSSRNMTDWWLSFWVSHNVTDYNYDNPEASGTNMKVESINLKFYISVYAGLVALNGVSALGRAVVFAWGGIRAATKLHAQLLQSVLSASLQFFETTPAGRLINRFSSDTWAVDDSLPFQINILLAQCFGLVGALVLVCVGLPFFLLFVPSLIIAYILIQVYYRPAARETRRLGSIALSPLYSHITEVIASGGVNTIRAFERQKEFICHNMELLSDSQRSRYCEVALSAWLGIRLQFLGVTIVSALVVIAMIVHHYSGGGVSAGLVGLGIAYALSITPLLGGFVTSFSEVEKDAVSMERIAHYITEIKSECSESEEMAFFVEPPHTWMQSSCGVSVSFENVSLAYSTGSQPALQNVSFDILARERIVVTGRTGAGKSSLFIALLKAAPLTGGRVLIDGIDIATIEPHTLRNRIAVIVQTPFLFSGPLRDSVDPRDEFTDFEVEQALRNCCLGDLLERLDGGIKAVMSEGGNTLSVGEKQLVCLARALLRRCKLVLIDEATAHIDHNTELHLLKVLDETFSNATVVTISHRLTLVHRSMRQLVMDNGNVVSNQ